MLISFSHLVDNRRVPLLDDQGREITLSVEAPSKTDAINSQDVKEFIAGLQDKENVRVRKVT